MTRATKPCNPPRFLHPNIAEWTLLNLVWVGGVRVDAGEVELAGNEEEHGAQVAKRE